MTARAASAIWVAHPGATSSVYELTAAVRRLGFATRLRTGFYYPEGGRLERLVEALPARLRGALARELKRRRFDGVDARTVASDPALELAMVAAARLLPGRPGVATALMHARNRQFDTGVARALKRDPPAALIGHDTSTLAAIRAARQVGTVSLVNQLIGHVAIGQPILREEAARFPDWADSLHADTPERLVQQCRDEVLEADRVLSPSDYVRGTLTSVGVAPERIIDLPFGVRIDRFHPSLAEPSEVAGDGPERPLRLLYVGQISQRKGLEYLLQAVRLLGRGAAELTLVGGVVGAGRGLRRHEGWFRHIPNLPFADIAALYRQADALVYPSLHEGSALAIMEAMASGLPVVTTANSGSLARDGVEGLIVPIRDVDALARAIESLRSDPARRRSMAAAARRRMESFTWDDYQRRLGGALDRLIAAPPQ